MLDPDDTPLLSHDLVVFDVSGKVVATGSIDLPGQFPPNGFEGSWQLKSATASFPTDAVFVQRLWQLGDVRSRTVRVFERAPWNFVQMF